MVPAYIAWGGSSAELHCGPHKWSPMIPQIASLYAPNGIKPNDLRPIVWVVCFLPWRPTSLLPTMDKDIPAGYLTERWHYFIAEIFMLCAVVGAILEVAAFIVNRVQRKPGGELSEPLLFEVQNRTRPSRPLWYALSFAMWYVVYQIGLYIAMDIMVMCGMISLETGPDWELWVIFIEAICATHLAVGLATYVVHRDRKHDHPSTMLATCLLPVLGNEIHIFKDHVAGALCFAVAHCSSGDLRTAGVVMGYLSLVSTFIPLALLCADPTARSGLPTAHWPIAEAAPPGNERCSPEEEVDNMFERIGFGKGHGTLRRLLVKIVGKVGGVRSFVNLAITATTWEKQLRAQSGELPHCILHLAFVFLFGGSAFIFFAIFISGVKIGMIPLVRETVLPGFIRTFGCSAAKLDVYFKNTAGKHLFVRAVKLSVASKSLDGSK